MGFDTSSRVLQEEQIQEKIGPGWSVGATLVHFLGPQKQEKPPLNVFRRGFWIWNCGDSRNRIDTAFSPTGLYKSLFYAEEMQV